MNEKLIKKLLVADIKHNQLINGLYNIGLMDNDKYTLDIDFVVAELLGIKNGAVPDEWLNTYHSKMLNLQTTMTDDEIVELANELFQQLKV
jgi:hypothetical protein